MTADDRELDAMRSCCATTEGSAHAVGCGVGAAPRDILRRFLTADSTRGLLCVGIPSIHSELFAEEQRLVDKISAGLQQRRELRRVASDELLDVAVGDDVPRGLVHDISMWDALPYQEYLLRRLELRRNGALDDTDVAPNNLRHEDASVWPCCNQRAVQGHAPWCPVTKAPRAQHRTEYVPSARPTLTELYAAIDAKIVIAADASPLIDGIHASLAELDAIIDATQPTRAEIEAAMEDAEDLALAQEALARGEVTTTWRDAVSELAVTLGADVPNPLFDDLTWVDERAIAAEIDAEEAPDLELERFVSRLGLIAWSILLVPVAAVLSVYAGMWLAEHAGPSATIASRLGQDAVVLLVVALAVVRLGGVSALDDTTHSPA